MARKAPVARLSARQLNGDQISRRCDRCIDRVVPQFAMTVSEFLAAWKLANDKARELGWIV
jgi:hypothetical protein